MITVTKTHLPDIERFKKYIDKIYSTGWLTNNGEHLLKLESELAKFLGVENLVLVSNGTIALQLAYKALGLKGEVITTPFSFVATTNTILWEGLTPVFSDINPDTYNLCPDLLENKINKNTSAIVPVHVFGNPCDTDAIEELSRKHNLKVIYDAAHAFGIVYKNKNIAAYGDAVTLSFHSTKIFHSIEGGAIIFRDKEHYNKAKLLRNFGIASEDNIVSLGINAKMNEFQAAMGLCVLEDFPELQKKRKAVYTRYNEAFKNIEGIKLQTIQAESSQNYSYFPILVNSEDILLKIKNSLLENQIAARRYFFPSLNTLSYVNQKVYMPVSESIASRILCLPIFENLDSETQDKIISLVKAQIK